MSPLLAWMFLGLVLPEFDASQDVLIAQRYHRMDRASDQDANDAVFARTTEPGPLGLTLVSVVVRSRNVSAIVIATQRTEVALAELIAADERCSRGLASRFDCKLGLPTRSIDVVACDKFVVLYSDEVAASRAYASICDAARQERPQAGGSRSTDRYADTRGHDGGEYTAPWTWLMTHRRTAWAAGASLVIAAVTLRFVRRRRSSRGSDGAQRK